MPLVYVESLVLVCDTINNDILNKKWRNYRVAKLPPPLPPGAMMAETTRLLEVGMKHAANVIPMADTSKKITRADVRPTNLPDDYVTSDITRQLLAFHMPRYDELPQMDLYRDQVIAFVDATFAPMKSFTDSDWLTPSMVNNYVKSGLIAPPQKRLYGREQIARLLVICIFKQVLSISAIAALFRIQTMTYMVDVAYDYVATELENGVTAAFGLDTDPLPDTAHRVTRESLLVRNAVSAFVSKMYLLGYLRFIGIEDS